MQEEDCTSTETIKSPWFVYCLGTVEKPEKTYVGATIDVDRRLKQHNTGTRAGGARATSQRPGEWYRVCYVEGFQTQKQALSFEWHWKHFSRKETADPLTRRQRGLDKCLAWASHTFPELVLKIVYE